MKKLFILASAAAIATAVYGNNQTYWIAGGTPSRTLPYITGTTTTDANDNIVFGMTGGTLTASVVDEITSASSKMQFSGSAGMAGDSTITINEGFTYNVYALTVSSAKEMVDGSVINFTGDGTLTWNALINLSNTTNHVTWNFNNAVTKIAVANITFNVGANNNVTISNLQTDSKSINFTNIGSGSSLVINHIDKAFSVNNFTVSGGSFDIARSQTGYAVNFTGTTGSISSISADSYIGYMGLNGITTVFTIGDLDHNIILSNQNITFFNGTLVLNSSNIFKRSTGAGQSAIGIECSSASTQVGVILGADNEFLRLKSNSGSAATVFTLDLNGYTFTLGTLTATKFNSIIIKDFADDLFRVKDLTDFDMDKLVVYSDDGSTLIDNADLEMRDMGAYYALSLKAIPEPATFAALFGALALAFAAYRRRK